MAHVLRGRDSEIGLITDGLHRTAEGAGQILIIEGGPGLGKSTLLAYALGEAQRNGFWCGSAGADAGTPGLDMAVVMEALVGGSRPIVELRESNLRNSQRIDHRLWLLQEVQLTLEGMSLQRPVLVGLDDLHWADTSSAFAIRVLAQWLVTFPVCWVLTRRPGAGNPALQRTLNQFAEEGATTISLSTLDRTAVADIASDYLGAVPNDELLNTLEQAAGNPFVLVDLLAALREEDQVAITDGVASLNHKSPPRRLANSVQARLRRLTPLGERTATLAASLGRMFVPAELARLSGLPVADIVIPIKEVLRAGIFTERGDCLQFQHDLVREVVRDSVPAAARRSLDREAAEVLLAAGAMPVDVADQLAASASHGDEVAIGVLKEAADVLVLVDPIASSEIARSALALVPNWHPLRGQMVARCIMSLFAAGSTVEASKLANDVLRHVMPREQEAEVRFGVSCMYSLSGDIRAENARIAATMPDISRSLRARAAASLVFNLAIGGRLKESVLAARDYEELIDTAEDKAARYTFDVAASTVEYEIGLFDNALDVLDQGEIRRQGTLVDDARQRCAQHYRCWILDVLDRFEEAAADANEGLAAAHRDRQPWAVHIFEVWQGRHFLQCGMLEDSMAALDGRYRADEVDQITSVVDASAAMTLGRVRLHLGDDRGAAEIASIAETVTQTATPGNRRLAAWFLALKAIAEQEPARAHSYITLFGEAERLSFFPLFPHEVTDDVVLMRLAVEVGDDELARHILWQARQRRQSNPSVTTIAAVVAHCQGLLDDDLDCLKQAVAMLEAGPRPLALAASNEDLGCAHLRRGQREDAIEAFDHALRLNAAAGASRDAGRVRRRLRELGARRRVVLLDRPRSGPQSLTDAELRVARLVADGNTNRAVAEKLFVSPHTVNTHLRHVFEKLAIKSRTELMRLSPELGNGEARPRQA